MGIIIIIIIIIIIMFFFPTVVQMSVMNHSLNVQS